MRRRPSSIDDLASHVSKAVEAFFRLFKTVIEAPAAPPARAKSAERVSQFNWDEIIGVAKKILADQPTRSWRMTEFVHAIKEKAGLASCKGLHLGLAPRMGQAGLISKVNQTMFRARSTKAEAKKPEAKSPPAQQKTAKKPAAGKKKAAKKGSGRSATSPAEKKKRAILAEAEGPDADKPAVPPQVLMRSTEDVTAAEPAPSADLAMQEIGGVNAE